MIGQIGSIVFTASAALVRTYADYSESVSARIGEHDVGGAYPLLEWIGPGVTSRSLPIVLNAALGVDVEADVAVAQGYCQQGALLTVVMGGVVVGGAGAMWLIETVDVQRREFDRNGVATVADLALGIKLAQMVSTPTLTGTVIVKRGTQQVQLTFDGE